MRHGLINVEDLNATALILEDGLSITYSKLLKDISGTADYLPSPGVIYIIGKNDYPSILLYLTALQTSAVPLFINRGAKPAYLADLIRRFSPTYVLAENATMEAIGEAASHYVYKSNSAPYTLFTNANQARPALHPDLAFLALTSGSTGSSKLVRITHRNLVSNARAIADYLELGPADRAISSLPLSYSYGLSVLNSHLFAGATVVLTDKSMMEKEFWDLIRTHSATSLAGVPYHYDMLLRLRFERLNAPSLRKMTQAGGRLAPEKIVKVHEACATLGIRFWTMYGQTEASPRISYVPSDHTIEKLGSIGRAIPGGHLWVCDDTGADVSESGACGELVYEGPNVCMGYAETADDLAKEDENAGVLHTGDLAHADADGYFFIDGRLKRFLKVFGNRISLDQIERTLSADGFECIASGDDDMLIVHVVGAEDTDTMVLRRQVASAAGINASAVTVNVIDQIPRLPTGKVDYQCLRQ